MHVQIHMYTAWPEAVFEGVLCRSWLLPVLQEALEAMTKEKARLKADMEYLQSQLDLVTQQAEAATCKDSSEQIPQVQSGHVAQLLQCYRVCRA